MGTWTKTSLLDGLLECWTSNSRVYFKHGERRKTISGVMQEYFFFCFGASILDDLFFFQVDFKCFIDGNKEMIKGVMAK